MEMLSKRNRGVQGTLPFVPGREVLARLTQAIHRQDVEAFGELLRDPFVNQRDVNSILLQSWSSRHSGRQERILSIGSLLKSASAQIGVLDAFLSSILERGEFACFEKLIGPLMRGRSPSLGQMPSLREAIQSSTARLALTSDKDNGDVKVALRLFEALAEAGFAPREISMPPRIADVFSAEALRIVDTPVSFLDRSKEFGRLLNGMDRRSECFQSTIARAKQSLTGPKYQSPKYAEIRVSLERVIDSLTTIG